MNNRKNVIHSSLRVVSLIAFGLLMSDLSYAQSSPKPVGEIASASRTTINGSSVISGMTVFSKNRIRTDKEGAAIINLGKHGRIEISSETDMTLRFAEGSIGGDLHSRRLVISAQAGVALAINTARGLVTTDGKQPAVLTIDVDNNRSLVIAHRGEARVISGSKVERVAAVGASGATSITNTARAASFANNRITTSTSSLPSLFNAGVNYSIDQVSGAGRGVTQPFETTITCRDRWFDRWFDRCDKKSEKKPKPRRDDKDDD